MDKNLETGLLIGAGLGLAMSPIIKKVAKALPGVEQIERKALPQLEHKQEEEQEPEVKFIPIVNAASDEEV